MVDVATVRAVEARSGTRRRVDVAAARASLARVRGMDLDEQAAVPGKLVTQHADQLAPASVEDPPRQAVIGSDHTSDLQFLDDDGRVALAESRRELMQNMLPLSPNFAMDAGDAGLGLFSVFRCFLTPRDDALGASQLS